MRKCSVTAYSAPCTMHHVNISVVSLCQSRTLDDDVRIRFWSAEIMTDYQRCFFSLAAQQCTFGEVRYTVFVWTAPTRQRYRYLAWAVAHRGPCCSCWRKFNKDKREKEKEKAARKKTCSGLVPLLLWGGVATPYSLSLCC